MIIDFQSIDYKLHSLKPFEPSHNENNNLGFLPGPIQIRLYRHRKELEALIFGYKQKRNCTVRVSKTKVLFSFTVTAQLICAFILPSHVVSFHACMPWFIYEPHLYFMSCTLI